MSLLTSIVTPAVGDKATSTWAGTVATGINLYFTGGPRIQYTQNTGGQSLPNTGNFTIITGYDVAADVDTFGGSTFNATTGIWTCPAAGQYEISGQVTATSGSARLAAGIQLNGATRIVSNYNTGTGTTWVTAVVVPKEFTLASGNTISLVGLPNAAAIVTSGNVNGNSCFLRIVRLS